MTMSRLTHVRLGGGLVTAGSRTDVIDEIMALSARDGADLVVTPNIHHVALLEADADFAAAYASASLWPADGWPVALAATLLSGRWVQRTAGSDLVEEIARRAARSGHSVAVVGGAGSSAELAANALKRRYPGLRVDLVDPLPSVEPGDASAVEALRGRLRGAAVDIVFLGLGAPKQEIFGHGLLQDLGKGVILCVGAGINFAAETQRRASPVLRALGLEWLHRLVQEPLRLGPRYVRSSIVFIRVFLRALGPNSWRRPPVRR
jgi:N-acetylglucosaminyldiphosphoundecaprenol N-acetyl-beta-D-mannosaminyltransferase